MSTIYHGDCIEVMAAMDADSVDAIVTDPPYGLGFMSKAWDGLPPGADTAAAMLRVLRPSSYLLAFGGTRTWHRLACALEDAGFEIRDTLMWLYGSGFPKGKACLKPAYEPVILARKPGKMRELGIEECRVGYEPADLAARTSRTGSHTGTHYGHNGNVPFSTGVVSPPSPSGRWPANVVLDEVAAGMVDGQSGVSKSGVAVKRNTPVGKVTGHIYPMGNTGVDMTYADSGGASRFYYVAKASRRERNEGCEGMVEREKPVHIRQTNDGRHQLGGQNISLPMANHHPTVKPVALMRWLVKLVAREGEVVLDPFTGSGTTGVACAKEGRDFIGIEREAEYVEIARRRIEAAEAQLQLVTA